MSKRRLDKLEGALGPKEAVLHWMEVAHTFGSLPACVGSLIDQSEAAQPFIARPARVEQAVWAAMRGQRPAFAKQVTREAVGDTVFLLRLVIGLNVHIDDVLRFERLRQASLYWWARALDSSHQSVDARKGNKYADWERDLATLRGVLLGTERARETAEAKYLAGHDCLFPDLAAGWHELLAASERLALSSEPVDETVDEAGRQVHQVVLMAYADGLEASGRTSASDDLALRVGRHIAMQGGGTDG